MNQHACQLEDRTDQDAQAGACECPIHQRMGWLLPGLAGAIMLLGLSIVSQLGVLRGEAFLAHQNQTVFIIFYATFLAASCLMGFVQLRFIPKRLNVATYWRTSWIIILFAVLLRICLIFMTTPQLSDDIWRYLYDGKVMINGDNPYTLSPIDRGPLANTNLVTEDDLELVDRINHPELITIYPPVSQYGFALTMMLDKYLDSNVTGLGGERLFRASLVLLELMVMLIITWQLKRMNRSPNWLWLYAVSPLALTEIAGTGHQDILGMSLWLLALSLWPISSQGAIQKKDYVRFFSSGLFWGASLLVKPITLPVAVYLCLRERRHWRGGLCFMGGGVMACILLVLPFLNMPGGIDGLLETGKVFSANWQFNGPLHGLIVRLFGHVTLTHVFFSGLLIAFTVLCACHHRLRLVFSLWDVAAITMMLSLLFSSTVHPWYLLWGVMFLPLSRLWSLHLFSLLVVLGYFAIADEKYQLPTWLSWFIHASVWATLLLECWRRLTQGMPENSSKLPSGSAILNMAKSGEKA